MTNEKQEMSYTPTTRQSNMELLRIIAMVMVLILHADFVSLGTPTHDELANDTLSSVMRFSFESICIVCVNIFVFISGWFGIHCRWKGLGKLIFQVLFITFLIYGCVIAFTPDTFSLRYSAHLVLMDPYWFAQCYLILYIISPLLNRLADRLSSAGLIIVLIVLLIPQTVLGWLGNSWIYGSEGNSVMTFIFIYLLARLMRRNEQKLNSIPRTAWLLTTILLMTFSTLLAIMGNDPDLYYEYTSPMVLAESVCLVVWFNGMKLHSRVINKVAASSFTVYLFNCAPYLFDKVYKPLIAEWYHSCPSLQFIAYTVTIIVVFFVGAIIIDQLRIACWKRLLKMKKNS